MKYPKLRELKEALKSLFSRPYTTRFPYGPVTPPIPEGFRGRPVYEEKECVGCGACAHVCPTGVIEITDDPKTAVRTLTQILDRCIYCGQCQRYCITDTGIQLTQEYNMVTTDRTKYRDGIEKKLVLCEHCRSIIGPRDHIIWIARRVGEAAFTNPTLMLTLLQDSANLKNEVPKPAKGARRADRIRILCHKCRKTTTLEL